MESLRVLDLDSDPGETDTPTLIFSLKLFTAK